MAFRLKLDEPIEKGFRRIGVEQIERARRQLAANADPASEVHEARKCMKRVRALLRLGRAGLGETMFRAENAHFRSIAATLASARDDHVLLETVVKLMAASEGSSGPALARLKDAVLTHRADQLTETGAERGDADAALERAIRRFRRLRIEPDTFSTLEQGLVRTYRKGLERRDMAYAENTDDGFHEWRKCVQTHWRHMQLLSRAWPELFEVEIDAARGLSQILGDDHDLALLRVRLSAFPPDTLSTGDTNEIEDLIAARQRALRAEARLQGEMIYCERPKAHGRRIAAVWHGAVKRSRDEDPAEPRAEAKRGRAKAPLHARG